MFLHNVSLHATSTRKNTFKMFAPSLGLERLEESPGTIGKLALTSEGECVWRVDTNIEIGPKASPLKFTVKRAAGLEKRTYTLILQRYDLVAYVIGEEADTFERRFESTEGDPVTLSLSFKCNGMIVARDNFNEWRAALERSFDLMDNEDFGRLVPMLRTVGKTPRRIQQVANIMFHRHQITSSFPLLEASLASSELSASLQKYGEEDYWRPHYAIATTLTLRYNTNTRNVEDLSRGITHMTYSIHFTPEESLQLATPLDLLGNLFYTRYLRMGNPSDLSQAIFNFHAQVSISREDSPARATYLSYLAEAFLEQFKLTSEPSLMSLAISHYHAAVRCTPADDPRLPNRMQNLALALLDRYKQRRSNTREISIAISWLNQVIQLAPAGDPVLVTGFLNLSGAFLMLYKASGDLEDLSLCIKIAQKAFDIIPQDDLKHRLLLHSNTASVLMMRFCRTRDESDVRNAVEHQNSAILLDPDDPTRIHDLGKIYSNWFEATEEPGLLDLAITNLERAKERLPPYHSRNAEALSELSALLAHRASSTGDLDATPSAMHAQQLALSITPDNDPALPERLAFLSYSFYSRFIRLGHVALEDVHQAISLIERSISLDPSYALRRIRLADYLYSRCARTWNVADATRAVTILEQALPEAPATRQNCSDILGQLGMTYDLRFQITKDMGDLTQAVSSLQQAVDTCSPKQRAFMLKGLANALTTRFETLGDLKDLALAISYQQNALELIPEDHSERGYIHNLIGGLFSARYDRTQQSEDVQAAMTHFKQSATHPTNDLMTRFQAAHNWASCCLEIDPSQSLVPFQALIELLSELAGMDQTTHARYGNLANKSEILARAIRTALDLGRLEMGLEWMEQARCLVWNQIDHLRSPLDQLRNEHPELAKTLGDVTRQLERISLQPAISSYQSSSMADRILIENDNRQHRELSRRRQRLLQDIRRLPGLSRFLLPPTAANILWRLPQEGPVVVFNIYDQRCDVLILSRNAISHIQLESCGFGRLALLAASLQTSLEGHRNGSKKQPRGLGWESGDASQTGLSSMLAKLWTLVVLPVVRKLDVSVPLDSSKRPRIWWCPSGPLAFLPLHAAGIYDQKDQATIGSSTTDYFVSSYTPTVTTLLNKIEAPSLNDSTSTSTLLVCQENTPGQAPLPGAKREVEALERLLARSNVSFIDTTLNGEMATVGSVTRAMKAHGWVHFACHAAQDDSNPLKSGIYLHDGRLRLHDVMQERLPHARHAFLSACQTSRGHEALTEEAVHLAAGMLAAGYRGVVATLWTIQDMEGARIAEEFYTELARSGRVKGALDCSESARALDLSIRNARPRLGEDESALLTWVPYIHFGR